MKETKFKGIVNGVEFDNVNDYNTAITKAIKEDVLKSASSSTEVVDCECTCDCDCECENCTCNANMLPGFSGNLVGTEYVDNYIDGNDKIFEKNVENLKKELGDNLEKIINKIQKMDKAGLQEYMVDIDGVMASIQYDTEATVGVIKKLDAELEKLREKLYVADRAVKVLNVWRDNYKAIRNAVTNELTKYNKANSILEPAWEADKEAHAKETQDLQKAIEILKKSLKDWCGIDVDNIDPNKPLNSLGLF